MNAGSAESGRVTFLGDFSKKLVTNTLSNLIGRSWSFVVTLLLTPYLLRRLDVGEFGVWVVLSVFASSFNLLDLGLGSTFVKYVSAFYTYEDYDRINEVLFSGLIFYGVLGVLLTVSGLLLERFLFSWFHIANYPNVFLIILIAGSAQNISLMFLSVFRGIQRMDKANAIEIKMSVVGVVGTVVFLETGFGIHGLAVNSLICALIATAVSWWEIRRSMPRIRLGWHLNRGLLEEMFKYGAQIQISNLGSLVCFQVDKLIISRVLGISSVSFYEVASRLTSAMRAVPLVMMSALIPATSELGARNDKDRILYTYRLASKYISMVTVAMVAYVVLDASSFVNLWIGSGFGQSVLLMQILAVGYGANVLGGPASQTGAGVGRPEFNMKSTLLLTVMNPILSFTLVQRFGSPGAAAGTSAAMISAALYLLIIFHRGYWNNSVWTVIREFQLRPIVAGVLADLAVLGFHKAVPQILAIESSRLLIPVKMASDFAVFVPVYIVLLVALRQVTAIDRSNFVGLVSFGFDFVRHPFRERVKIYR